MLVLHLGQAAVPNGLLAAVVHVQCSGWWSGSWEEDGQDTHVQTTKGIWDYLLCLTEPTLTCHVSPRPPWPFQQRCERLLQHLG